MGGSTKGHMVLTLGPGLSNLQKVDNLATRVNLLPMLTTVVPNAGPRVLQKGIGEGVIYMQISEMLNLGLYLPHLVGAYNIYTEFFSWKFVQNYHLFYLTFYIDLCL